jgi:acyl dehydratase
MEVVSTVEELKTIVGRVVSISQWFAIDQDRIDAFADVTLDHQWIHVDVDSAKKSSFGGTIAHGMLTAAIAAHLPEGETFIRIGIPMKMGVNYGFNRIRFPSPLRSGLRIRTVVELIGVEEVSENIVQLTRRNTVEIEGSEKPAMVSESISRIYMEDGNGNHT